MVNNNKTSINLYWGLTTYIQDTSKHLFKLSPWMGVGPKLVRGPAHHIHNSGCHPQHGNKWTTLLAPCQEAGGHCHYMQEETKTECPSTLPKVTQLINYDLRGKVTEYLLWATGLSTTCLDEGNFYSRTFFLNLYIVPLIMVRTRAVITERSGPRRKHLEGEGETDQAPCRAGWLNRQLRKV